MNKRKTALMVMAAGMGSRYGGIKQLDSVGLSGETILEFGLFDAVQAGFDEVVYILRRDIEEDFRKLVLDRVRSPLPFKTVFQETGDIPEPWASDPAVRGRKKPWGTAQAIWCAREAVDCPFAVINADDFYGRRSYNILHQWLGTSSPQSSVWSLAGYQLQNTLSDNGTVSRGICGVSQEGLLKTIEEHTQLSRSGAHIVLSTLPDGAQTYFSAETTVSMNMFGFTPRIFDHLDRGFREFLEISGTDPKKECYLPAVVGKAVAEGTAAVQVLESPETWFGVTYQEDRPVVQRRIRDLVSQGLYPANLWSPL